MFYELIFPTKKEDYKSLLFLIDVYKRQLIIVVPCAKSAATAKVGISSIIVGIISPSMVIP